MRCDRASRELHRLNRAIALDHTATADRPAILEQAAGILASGDEFAHGARPGPAPTRVAIRSCGLRTQLSGTGECGVIIGLLGLFTPPPLPPPGTTVAVCGVGNRPRRWGRNGHPVANATHPAGDDLPHPTGGHWSG
ncbi:hypothetical protein FRAHR75_640041 [Frankia sp. Hr75.2]|nr:hypothetical protein FRAHR75_640041 [Frankia sp. Hr75.2]SQD97703.1 conserved hypothetical protein [Parafrankia sp. Ea1.12]